MQSLAERRGQRVDDLAHASERQSPHGRSTTTGDDDFPIRIAMSGALYRDVEARALEMKQPFAALVDHLQRIGA